MEFVKKHKNKIIYVIALGIVFAIWFRMHTYMISIVPWGVHLDEAALGYNAYCIANWGVDRYLNYMPVYVANFEGGQSALYTYMCAVLIKFLGTGTLVLRIPAFLFGLITLVSGFMIVKKKYGYQWALLAALLISILPYFTQQARFGLDCNLMLGAVTLATWIFLEALEKKRWYWYLLDGILWGMTLYTYALSYVIVPLFLLVMTGYLLAVKKVRFRDIVLAAIPFILLALPLFLMVLINRFGWKEIVTPFFTIPRLGSDRTTELSFHGFFYNLVTMLKTLFYYDEMDYNALIGFNTMYMFSVPFVIIGACVTVWDSICAVKEKRVDVSLVMLVYCISQLFVGSMKTGTCINNMNGVYFSFLYFVVAAIHFLFCLINRIVDYGVQKQWIQKTFLLRNLKYIALMIIIAGYLVRFGLFYNYYFYSYPRTDYPQFLFNGRMDEILEEFGTDFGGRTVYMEAYHIYYLLSSGISPYEIDLENGMSQYGNIHFVDEAHGMPDFIDPDAIYLVRETNGEYREFLKGHFNTETWSGFYRIFRNE